MYDQIYSNLTFEAEHFNPVSLFPEMKEYTIYIDGISKCLAATGVRVGWDSDQVLLWENGSFVNARWSMGPKAGAGGYS